MRNLRVQSFMGVLLANLFYCLLAFAIAWEFNDGKGLPMMLGVTFLGMVFPNAILGAVTRLAGYRIHRYFFSMAMFAVVLAVAAFGWM